MKKKTTIIAAVTIIAFAFLAGCSTIGKWLGHSVSTTGTNTVVVAPK